MKKKTIMRQAREIWKLARKYGASRKVARGIVRRYVLRRLFWHIGN